MPCLSKDPELAYKRNCTVFCIEFCPLPGTYYSFDRYYFMKKNGSPDKEYGVAPLFAGEFDYYLGLKRTWLAFGRYNMQAVYNSHI